MIHAYDKNYLSKAQNNLASMLDFAVYDLEEDLSHFYLKFLQSKICSQFERGESTVIVGKSGVELALDIIGDETLASKYRPAANRTPEYWCGWALAYFQWFTKRPFKNIAECVTMQEILQLYPTLHEASEEKFVETVNRLICNKHLPTRLQKRRKDAQLTQKELAGRSGVKLRTIQQYEMRAKNINKAAAETLLQLAQVLYCSIEDLLEYDC